MRNTTTKAITAQDLQQAAKIPEGHRGGSRELFVPRKQKNCDRIAKAAGLPQKF